MEDNVKEILFRQIHLIIVVVCSVIKRRQVRQEVRH